MVTLRALDPWLLTHAANPLVRTRRGVASLAGLSALEAPRVDVIATSEQRAEEGDCSVLADHRPAEVVAFIRAGCRSSGVAGGAG